MSGADTTAATTTKVEAPGDALLVPAPDGSQQPQKKNDDTSQHQGEEEDDEDDNDEKTQGAAAEESAKSDCSDFSMAVTAFSLGDVQLKKARSEMNALNFKATLFDGVIF